MTNKNPEKFLKPILISIGAIFAFIVILLLLYISSENKSQKTSNDTVVINEVCADNTSVETGLNGVFCDYIELYNPTSEDINLSGYYLSNSKKELNKFAFPENTIIQSKNYLIVYGKNDSGYDTGKLTANFRITKNQKICLSLNGTVISGIAIPNNLQQNTSYGSTTDASVELSAQTATPCASNATANLLSSVNEPVFSCASGFYSDAFELEIKSDKNTTIYYTLDGSTPTVDNAIQYAEPISVTDASQNENVYSALTNFTAPSSRVPDYTVDKAVIVRAIAVANDGSCSNTATATYFIGFDGKTEYDNVKVMSLVSDPDGLFGDDNGILVTGSEYLKHYVSGGTTNATEDFSYSVIGSHAGVKTLKKYCNFFKRGYAWERPVHIDYFDEEHNLVFSQEAGVRVRGNSTRANQIQKYLTLFARKMYDGSDDFKKSFFDDNSSLSSVALAKAFAIRRYFLSGLLQNRACASQQYTVVQVFLDGEYWGAYTIQDKYDAAYMEDHFGVSKDDLIMLSAESVPGLKVQEGNDDDLTLFDNVVQFVQNNDMSNADNYNQFCNMVDIQSLIDYYSAQVYLCNGDWSWRWNVYWWRSRSTDGEGYNDGKWRLMYYDLDYSTGIKRGTTYDVDSFTKPAACTKMTLADDVFIPYLIKNPDFCKQFAMSFMDMANDCFEPDYIYEKMNLFESTYETAVNASYKRYNGFDSVTFEENVSSLAKFFDYRYDVITDDLKGYFNLQGNKVNVTLSSNSNGCIALNTIQPDISENNWSGLYYTDYPLSVKAVPNDGYVFKEWRVVGGQVTDAQSSETEISLSDTCTIEAVFEPITEAN